MNVPPYLDEASFIKAIEEFRGAVGPEWVFIEEDTNLYRDAYSPLWDEEEERKASAAVAPASVEEVQKIVLIAGAHGIPLDPISTGMNLGYGG